MRSFAAHIAARYLPPVVAEPLRQAAFRLKLASPRRIWDGVYPHFLDVPVFGPGYEDAAFQAGAAAGVRRLLRGQSTRGRLDDESGAMLGLVSLMAERTLGRRITVLDFGGGPGVGYAQILGGFPAPPQVAYHVVELPSVCATGQRLFGRDAAIRFHESIPPDVDFDLVYAAGVLEHFAHWRRLLETWCALRPRWVLLTNVCCGDFQAYASSFRLIQGSSVPCWFLNTLDMTSAMAASGYSVVLHMHQERTHAQDNFPAHLRLPGGHSSAFLFARHDQAGLIVRH